VSYASDIAFTPAVKAIQERKGSRPSYARMEESGSWETRISPDLKAFVEEQTSVFLASANLEGQPYIQHRGGPPGFLKVLDEETIAFVDFVGNRQYITLGNLAENPKAHLFLIDYVDRRRVKLWGEARVVEGDSELTALLMPKGYKAPASQVIVFKVQAWDANCPQHIPRRLEASEVAAALAERDERIAELEAQLQALRAKA
jgi:predicted pyridoxine 5'-phosphate oxidase superfamily flavin-nucleotide-binding protein